MVSANMPAVADSGLFLQESMRKVSVMDNLVIVQGPCIPRCY